MVLDFRNFTPFQGRALPLTARNGATILRIVLKASFDIQPDGSTTVSAEQSEVVLEDVWWGKPAASAIRYESEVILGKPRTDLLVNGEACAPLGDQVSQVDVGLAYQGRVIKRLRVSGDRHWRRGPFGWQMSSPKPFSRMPVTFDRAFGGIDADGAEPRNHAGMGYSSQHGSAFEGAAVPNVEYPDQLVGSFTDRPKPAGMGVVARHWDPRRRFAGTYDEAWLNERFPLLPDDFDEHFFQTAPEDQWIDPRGGEQIDIVGMTPQGRLRCRIPSCDMTINLRYADREQLTKMKLETVMVEPTPGRVLLTWGASADIHGDPFKLHDIEVWQGSTDSHAAIAEQARSEAQPEEAA